MQKLNINYKNLDENSDERVINDFEHEIDESYRIIGAAACSYIHMIKGHAPEEEIMAQKDYLFRLHNELDVLVHNLNRFKVVSERFNRLKAEN